MSDRSCASGWASPKQWTDYLFGATDIRRLDFATWSGNHAMCRVGLRLGWREEARFRDARMVDGVVHDSVVYGMLRREWKTRRQLALDPPEC
ncbi:GNAT family protein [Arthrobacter sp. H5]|uniref:GNAT family N-acetyltransferase n=1 Tax=Arthrobacter sp. H5 TaxID=1267973 RepID=UPI0006891246|nr:GNAT family protein [Arthrobacter sp. H5]